MRDLVTPPPLFYTVIFYTISKGLAETIAHYFFNICKDFNYYAHYLFYPHPTFNYKKIIALVCHISLVSNYKV